MSGNPRLAHTQNAHQLVDRELVMQQNVHKPQSGFIGEGLEMQQCHGTPFSLYKSS